jgi:hypothetical protein
MKDFVKGCLCGGGVILAVVILVSVFSFFYKRDRKILESAGVQNEIQKMVDDVNNRSGDEFLLGNSGVRGAADNGFDEFKRKRDEAVERIRSRHFD